MTQPIDQMWLNKARRILDDAGTDGTVETVARLLRSEANYARRAHHLTQQLNHIRRHIGNTLADLQATAGNQPT